MATFLKDRLIQAREIRGLNKNSLAMLASISPMSLSNYEAGKQVPRPEGISRLSKALAVPESFFYKPFTPLKTPVFFRAGYRQKKIFQDQWKQYSVWLNELIEVFAQYLDFPPLKIPQIDLGPNWETVTDRQIEKIAYDTREYLGLHFGPIPNMVKLLENSGCIVLRLSMDSSEDGFSRWILDEKLPIIFLAKDVTSACRDRTSAAHELGHLVMHRNITPTEKNLKIIEHQAWLFAAAFLLPEKGYARDFTYASLSNFVKLKEKWKVSIAAQIMRCAHLEFINENSKRNLFINLSKKGWKTSEPLDDSLPLEEPNLLTACINLLTETMNIPQHEIAEQIGLPVQDIARLVGMPIDYFDPIDRNEKLASPRAKIIPFSSPH